MRWGLIALVAAVLVAAAPVGAAPPPAAGSPPAGSKPASRPAAFVWSCKLCHVPSGWRAIPERVAFDHDVTGWPLRGAHKAAACAGCHRGAHVQSRPSRQCAGCHTDKHQGEFGPACERCHTPKDWHMPRRFEAHDATRMPLVGAHAHADCTGCHVRAREGQYRGTPVTCESCHLDQYRRTTTINHVAGRFDTDCARCHGQIAWSPARFDHNRFFPLEATHKAQPCAACHPSNVYGGTSSACYSCHASAYNGPTHPDHKALHFPTDCGPCHAPTTWKQVRKSWHDGFFPTSTGKHAGLSCGDCHAGTQPFSSFVCTGCHTQAKTNGRHGDVGGYVWASQACYSCHPRGKAE